MTFDALGLLELDSIARGIKTGDVVVKKAPIKIIQAHTISKGRYIILFAGDVAAVEASYNAGIESAGKELYDSLFIPNIHLNILQHLSAELVVKRDVDSLSMGMLETSSVSSIIRACDQTLKNSYVELIEMRLGSGIGGKGYFVIRGKLEQVEAGIDIARSSAAAFYLYHDIIPNPDRVFLDHFLW